MNSAFDRYSFASVSARCIAGTALVAALALPGVGVSQAWADEANSKDEIVYVKGSSTGQTQGIYVVNVFDSDSQQTLDDPANYTSVTNLTTNQVLTQENGAVELTTTANEPFYYQGDMDASTQLPWNITVTYYLNGEEVTPEELAGADGLVKVVFDAQAIDDGSEASDFANSYILQAQGTFAESHFVIADTGDATLAHSGSNQVVNCLILPGESETFEISGLASNFQYDGWQVAGMSLSMAVDISGEDTSQLTDACEELESATSKIADGSSSLSSGASSLSDGASQVADGASSLSAGASNVASGAQELSSGVSSAVAGLENLSSAGQEVASGWSSVRQGIQSVSSNVAQIAAGSTQYLSGLKSSMNEYAGAAAQLDSAKAAYAQAYQAAAADPTTENVSAMNTAAQNLASVSSAAGAYGALSGAVSNYSTIDSGVQALNGGLSDLADGASTFDSGLSDYLAGASSAADQAGALASGASSLASGAGQVADGASSVSSGADQVASGAKSLDSGSDELSSGAAELASSVEGMDETIIDELQDTIDEKLGGDFTPHSFVVPNNTNVDKVQFVYVIEGISEPEDDTEDDADSQGEESESFIDRLFSLFQ